MVYFMKWNKYLFPQLYTKICNINIEQSSRAFRDVIYEQIVSLRVRADIKSLEILYGL